MAVWPRLCRYSPNGFTLNGLPREALAAPGEAGAVTRPLETMGAIATRLEGLLERTSPTPEPEAAGQLVRFVRLEGVPAILELTALLSRRKKAHETARQAMTRERMAGLGKMFAEVEDIGRMIHLISLNASVEAARAGGESGRSFKVIADEIRSLAAKSADLIETTRSALRSEAAIGPRHG